MEGEDYRLPDMDGAPDAEGEAGYDWSAFYDGDGRIYYYNNTTGESSWEAPEQFNPPPPPDDASPVHVSPESQENSEEGNRSQSPESRANSEEGNRSPREDVGEPAISSSQWAAYQDESGNTYYYNNETGETQWEKPEGFVEDHYPAAEDESAERITEGNENREPVPSIEANDAELNEQELEEGEEGATAPEPEEEVDPAVKRLADAEKALNEPDAIMEPRCITNVTELVAGLGGNVGGPRAIQALIESFSGQTAICGLLAHWLADLKATSISDDVNHLDTFKDAANGIREIVQNVVIRLAKERFSKSGGDSILELSSAEAAFLKDMIDSSRWRKLLIDLSASNKDSGLLNFCLRSISKRGHHREIARRINQSDDFAVFNAMLTSEFAVVGKMAITASSDVDTAIGMDELVADLRRTCTATAYTYLFGIEILRHLVASSKIYIESLEDNQGKLRFIRVTQKWERLREELEKAMVEPAMSAEAARISPLFRKRRLDVALTISDLHQRQRRRIHKSKDADHRPTNRESHIRDALENALVNFLRRHSIGTQLDDRVLDSFFPNDLTGEAAASIGFLLIQHPLSVTALLGHLFKPGSTRVTSDVVKNKCARLIALATIAAERNICNEAANDPESFEPSDEVPLTRSILKGSQLCELLENTVSFIVTTDSSIDSKDLSPGRQLCGLALRCAPVAQGVLMWAQELISAHEFDASASYPTLSPSILSLIRIISMRHPFCRTKAIEVAVVFLSHSNSEVSYQKMTAIKEQSLRLLLFLLINGEFNSVLGSLTIRLQLQGDAALDASLVRYFLDGLLEVVRPPVSLPFVRSLGTFLLAPKCVEAVRTTYFSEKSRGLLVSLLASFGSVLKNDGIFLPSTSKDASLVSALLATYAPSAA